MTDHVQDTSPQPDSVGPFDCSATLDLLERFLDDEMDPLVKAEVQRHLGACADCNDNAEIEQGVRHLVQSSCVEQAPAELVARLTARFGPLS